MKSALNARLLSAAELVRQDATFADIGTDHAYLPLFLLDEGRIGYAYCCDINGGPLNSARRNAEERGRAEQMTFILTDGAAALADKGITDYAICGMGGELIADIIDRAPHLKDGNVNLILQPMTRQEKLRSYLASSGFKIMSESYSFDAGKYYVCLLASFDGKCREISELEAIVGSDKSSCVDRDNRRAYLASKLKSLENALNGKREAGINCDEDSKLIAQIKEYISNI
ncbi:MAG: SAM-dependent methyltransferase [Clostridia bacterium]|nr:SAM-dependent methyltransferase [Clostridia bacterium]